MQVSTLQSSHSINSFIPRAIQSPFQRGLSTKLVGLFAMFLYGLALFSNFAEFSYMEYAPNLNRSGTWYCINTQVERFSFLLSIKNALLASYIPIPIIVIIQLKSYGALQTSGSQFYHDRNIIKRLKRIRKTFKIASTSFFILVAPADTFFLFVGYIISFHPQLWNSNVHLLSKLARFINLVVSLNSCVNPFIYAKVQRCFTGSRCFTVSTIINIRRDSRRRTNNTATTTQVNKMTRSKEKELGQLIKK